jgi:hypothetical protein
VAERKKKAGGTRGGFGRLLALDAAVYDRRAVASAAEEFASVCRVRVRAGEGPIAVDFGGDGDDELEFMNLALLRTIEERRR